MEVAPSHRWASPTFFNGRTVFPWERTSLFSSLAYFLLKMLWYLVTPHRLPLNEIQGYNRLFVWHSPGIGQRVNLGSTLNLLEAVLGLNNQYPINCPRMSEKQSLELCDDLCTADTVNKWCAYSRDVHIRRRLILACWSLLGFGTCMIYTSHKNGFSFIGFLLQEARGTQPISYGQSDCQILCDHSAES